MGLKIHPAGSLQCNNVKDKQQILHSIQLESLLMLSSGESHPNRNAVNSLVVAIVVVMSSVSLKMVRSITVDGLTVALMVLQCCCLLIHCRPGSKIKADSRDGCRYSGC